MAILFILYLLILFIFYLYLYYIYYGYFIYIIFTYIIYILFIFILYLRLRNSLKKFYGRYPDLIGKYQRLVKNMVADSFPD